MTSRRHIVVFSGGSAANNLVDVFGKVAEDRQCSLSYIIPISDNGGSSSELIRVFGGPGIGDVRSRLVRLIPSSSLNPEATALKTFFNHRLSSVPSLAATEFHSILSLTSSLWNSVSPPKRELIRSFLNHVHFELIKRVRPTSSFNFQSASVGNLFLTGARLFTGSFEASIYLLGAIAGVPSNVSVVPAINSNFSHHISAGLADGKVITGQNSISHPSAPSATAPPSAPSTLLSSSSTEDYTSHHTSHVRTLSQDLSSHDLIEDANLPGSLPTLRKQYIEFAKTHTEDLPSRIERIWYINPYGQEIRPAANPKVLSSIEEANAIIYSIGSLYTSIIPCLILRDVGKKIASSSVRYKILILNGSLDRETRSNGVDFNAKDFVKAIVDACAGTEAQPVPEQRWRDYVTHLVYLQGEGTPVVEKEELAKLRVECVRVYGRRNPDGGMLYDGEALTQALAAVIGVGSGIGGFSRRNTLAEGAM